MKKTLYYHPPEILALFVIIPVFVFLCSSTYNSDQNQQIILGSLLCALEGIIAFVIYTILKKEQLFNDIDNDIHFIKSSKIKVHDIEDIELPHLQHWHSLGQQCNLPEIEFLFKKLIAEYNKPQPFSDWNDLYDDSENDGDILV